MADLDAASGPGTPLAKCESTLNIQRTGFQDEALIGDATLITPIMHQYAQTSIAMRSEDALSSA
jgi:hypothetical protein